MQTPRRTLPWYFHPGWFWAVLLASFPIQIILYLTAEPLVVSVLGALGLVFAAFYFSWSYLLYEYLAPKTPDSSRHWPGRNKVPISIILASVLLIVPLNIIGPNTEKPNEIADLIVLPIFICFFLLNWRACDLLVSLERDKYPYRSVTLSFIAMFYLPVTIGWFYGRLRNLERAGNI